MREGINAGLGWGGGVRGLGKGEHSAKSDPLHGVSRLYQNTINKVNRPLDKLILKILLEDRITSHIHNIYPWMFINI